jgi:hypothetical protein
VRHRLAQRASAGLRRKKIQSAAGAAHRTLSRKTQPTHRYRNLWTRYYRSGRLPSLSTAPRLRETPPKIPNPILLFSELLRIRPGIQNGRGNLNGSAFSAVDGVEMPCLPKKDVSIGVDRASISLGVTIFLMSDFDSYGRPLRLLRPPS